MDRLPGSFGDAGFELGRRIQDLVEPAFLSAYLARLQDAIGFDPRRLRSDGLDWLHALPAHFGEEIEAMARGARVDLGSMVDLLYADIARSHAGGGPGGPMCSAVSTRLADGGRWVARNCDWLTPTLLRGVAAVVHEVPGRIPIMAVGIRGDIDVDTGLNAEGLWLHLHTLHAVDPPPEDREPISWLFWAREALETCATINQLEAFIQSTARDRGVFVIAAEARTGASAVFECGRACHVRHDAESNTPLCVTNHSLDREVGPRATGMPNQSGTISRRATLQQRLDARAPAIGPDDLMSALAADGVEMRAPKWIRTIYSAVADPRGQRVWFASGTPDGAAAASRGRWRVVSPPWARRGECSSSA